MSALEMYGAGLPTHILKCFNGFATNTFVMQPQSSFYGGLLCSKKEKHSNAEKWCRVIIKRATTSEKTGERRRHTTRTIAVNTIC
jgi:hypothetical protein